MNTHLGRYEIVGELGRGAMGIVYKARDPLIERYVALKSIDLHALTPEKRQQFRERFYQEAKAAGHLNHPNIVTIHDLGESGDMAYLAMELMEGRELQHFLDGARRLSVEDALDIAIQVADALDFAHQRGVVHRDIKPSNIMVLGNNVAKIVDFGIAKMTTQLGLTQDGLIIGSPLYMSPEQISSKPVDARSDLFSFGVVLYEMLTQQRPFAGEDVPALMYQIVNAAPQPPSALNPQVNGKLDAIVMRCMEKQPERRYAHASDLADALRQCRDELLRTRLGLTEPSAIGLRMDRLRRMATPGGIPETSVLLVAYVSMILIFAFDVLTDTRNATIQMHLLYLFPLAMVGFHCERVLAVRLVVAAALALQAATLVIEPLPLYARVFLAALFVPSDIFIVYLTRIARVNFIEVAKLAAFDGMTGLRNRLSFESVVEAEIARLGRAGGALSFAFIDLDNLKELNHAKGYLAGDNAIKLVAKVLAEQGRQYDTAARIGGDEFAILMPDTDSAECEVICQRLTHAVEKHMAEAGLPVRTSIGHSTFAQAPSSISEVFLKAENAMHAAQRQAREQRA